MLGSVLGIPPASGAELSARDIMERNFYTNKIKQVTNDSTLTFINDKGQRRVRKMHSVSALQPNRIDSKLLIRFLFPADMEGTGYSQIQHHDGDDDMWIYLPALKKVRRLVANNKKDSFFGSDIAYGDILLPVVGTYRHTLLKSETLEGEDCWVIESVPVSEKIKKDHGYAAKTSWIRKSNFMAKKVDYLDTAGRFLKTLLVPEVKEVDPADHKWWAMQWDVANHQTGHHSVLVFENLDTKSPVKDDFFTTRYLEREK